MAEGGRRLAAVLERLRAEARPGVTTLALDRVAHDQEGIAVDCTMFADSIASLPQNEDVKLVFKNGALAWSCNSTHGKLAVNKTEMPESIHLKEEGDHDEQTASIYYFETNKDVARGFELGANSVGSSSMLNVGLGGITLRWQSGEMWFLSSDNVSISAYKATGLPETKSGPLEKTISAKEANILKMLASRQGGTFYIRDTGILYLDNKMTAFFTWLSSMKNDIYSVVVNFLDGENIVALPKARVTAFISRAQALAQVRGRFFVSLKIANAALSLEFAEATAQTTEYELATLIEGTPDCHLFVDAVKMSAALGDCVELVVDHIENNVLLFRAEDAKFFYMISAKASEE